MTKGCKGLCWWSTWEKLDITTDRIVSSYWRVLLAICVNDTHKIISIYSSSFGEFFEWISMQLWAYCRIIPWFITQPGMAQFLNIKLGFMFVHNNPCMPNMLKNVNNKRGGDFVEWIILYILTNNFLISFAFDPKCITFILSVMPNTYGINR